MLKERRQPVPARVAEPDVHQWGYTRPSPTVAPTLSPRPQRWGFGAGVPPLVAVAYAGAQLVAGTPWTIAPAAVGAVAASGAITAFGLRRRERDAISDRATEDIAYLVATRLTRQCLKVLRWEGGWIGHPKLVRISYAQGAAETPGLREELAHALSSRFGRSYRLAKDDPRRRRLVYEEYTPDPEPEEPELSEIEQRIDKVVEKLFSGKGGNPPDVDLEWDDAGVAAISVRHDIGDLIAESAVRRVKERKFSNMVPGRWRATWDTSGDQVVFARRPELPTFVAHPPIPEMTGRPQDKENYETPIAYGVDEFGTVMAWRPWLQPMMLITGVTGRGKTVVAHSVLTELAARGWIIDVSDAKLVEFIGYKSWPNVRCVASRLEEQVRLIHAAHDLMKERYAQIVDGSAKEEDFEPYCLVVDEFALWREDLTDWYMDIKRSGDPSKAPAPRKVAAIVRAGRTARVHLVTLTQRPDAETFGNGETRTNYSCRVSLGPLDFDGSRMMWGLGGLGMAVDRSVRGRGTTFNENGEVVDFQAYWTPDPRKTSLEKPKDMAILAGLRPAQELHGKMKIILPKPSVFDDKSASVLPPSYSEYASARMVPADQEETDQDSGTQDSRAAEPAAPTEGGTGAAGVVPLQARDHRNERTVLEIRHGNAGTGHPGAEVVPLRPAPAQPGPQDEPEPEAGYDDPRSGWRLDMLSIEHVEAGFDIHLDDGGWAAVQESLADEDDEDLWNLLIVTDSGEEAIYSAPCGEAVAVRVSE
ncbi:hypothetical protein SPF06_18945 [Sinomonas sp. JGH33]|uniref:FtsK domain-containing protein n=1 Tax=Sinomonas terricola TaxID=3110330 RepID=A0ABU5TAY5_9MICC|nr:hypothetical protein [Sinomonas sp. JGH33]MEA5456805.1 hypothetical protein [Sinomonas sp. JGH33]